MVREGSVHHTFLAPWEHTTTAFWCKYPHPELPHVTDALVLSRRVDPETGVLHSRRLMCMSQSLPPVLRPLAGGLETYFALEESTVDPARRRMVLRTRNLSFASALNAEEVCVYQGSEDGLRTDYTWTVRCACTKTVPLITANIEQALVDRALGNSASGLAKMDALAEDIHRRSRVTQRPAFARWPTRFPSRACAGSGGAMRQVEADAEQLLWQRRFGLFGPRKPLSRSSWNPFGGPDDEPSPPPPAAAGGGSAPGSSGG